MPIHDWTRVRANRFHDFHQSWTIEIRNALNRGILPPGYFAMAEQKTGGREPDVVALELNPKPTAFRESMGGLAVQEAPPKTHYVTSSDESIYARKANRISVRHPDGEVVAIIEVVSSGNKSSIVALDEFVRKSVDFLDEGIHLLVIDLFPPSKRDPQGVHKAIWDRIKDEPYNPPHDRPLTFVSYAAGPSIVAYVEPALVGQVLPDMPIFLTQDRYVNCPLEATYQIAWNDFPAALKGPLEDRHSV